MIKEINKNQLLNSFLDIVIEVEFGTHFDRNDISPQQLLESKINNFNYCGAKFFGMYKEGEPIGFITTIINTYTYHDNDCEILEIGIIEKHKNKGYGTELLHFIENEFKKYNLYCIFVKTAAFDYKVIHFYGKNGYVPIAVIPDTEGPKNEGTIVMRKYTKRDNTSHN